MHRRKRNQGYSENRPIEQIVGRAPSTPGDVAGAKRFLARITRTLEGGTLSQGERRALYKQRERWTKRADGSDMRWMIHGSAPGRPSKAKLSKEQREEIELEDPIVAEIIRKYDRPRRAD
jgi:hypothetical protein